VTLHFVTVQTEDALDAIMYGQVKSGYFENWNTCLILKSEMVILWKTRVTFFYIMIPNGSQSGIHWVPQ
jgi:hypothetical protein